MIKNLGRVVFLLLISINIFANVTLSVDKNSLVVGDKLRVTITTNSSNTVLPALDNIGGYDVLNISSSSSTSIINSNITHIKSRTYTIKPTSSFTIPVLEVTVEGVKQYTKPKDITVQKASNQSHSNSDKFILKITSNKKDIKVGESFNIKVTFKRRVDTNVQKIALPELTHEAFWIKKIGSDSRDIVGDYEVYTREYLLFAQKDGDFTIENIIAKVGVLKAEKSNYNDPFFDSFFQRMIYKNVHSNSVNIHVSPLPNNLEVFGDFSIKASVDKSIVYTNKPINFTIKIQGEGNIEDIKKFDIKIPDTTIFADTPKTKLFIRDKKQYGEFTQKFAIVSDSNFTIPKVIFTYFSSKDQKQITKETKEFKIEVKGTVKKITKIENSTIETKSRPLTFDKSFNYLYFLLGTIFGILITILAWFFKTKTPKQDDTPLIKKIKKTRSDKELYDLLLPIAKDDNVKNIINTLEENIYENKNIKVDKNSLIRVMKDNE